VLAYRADAVSATETKLIIMTPISLHPSLPEGERAIQMFRTSTSLAYSGSNSYSSYEGWFIAAFPVSALTIPIFVSSQPRSTGSRPSRMRGDVDRGRGRP